MVNRPPGRRRVIVVLGGGARCEVVAAIGERHTIYGFDLTAPHSAPPVLPLGGQVHERGYSRWWGASAQLAASGSFPRVGALCV